MLETTLESECTAVAGVEANKKTACYRNPRVDGCYAWFLVGTSFIIDMVIDGTSLSYGVLYPDMIGTYPDQRVVLSAGGSIILGLYMMAGNDNHLNSNASPVHSQVIVTPKLHPVATVLKSNFDILRFFIFNLFWLCEI